MSLPVRLLLCFLFFSILPFTPCNGQGSKEYIYNLSFKPLTAYEALPTDEVTRVMQDSNGYIWIATNSGLFRYDGYRLQAYKDNRFTPELLTNNTIKCIVEDKHHQLWIGTRRGLNVLNLKTGDVREITHPALVNQEITTLHVDYYNNVWVATLGALFYFKAGEDAALIPCSSLPEGENLSGVNALLTDSKKRMWIGTWSSGLFRFDYENACFISYPQMNKRNSVHVLFEDSRHVIWIGSWGEGLFRMENMDNPQTVTWKHFLHDPQNTNSLSDDIIYCMAEDQTNHSLWIGTRNGLSILDLDTKQTRFVNYLPENIRQRLPYNELNSIIRDSSGIMWLGMLGGGIYYADMRPRAFKKGNIEPIRHQLYSNSVRSLFVDDEEVLWMGIGSHGLAMQEKGKDPVYLLNHTDFQGTKAFHTINAIIQRRESRELWFATWGNGIYVYNRNKTKQERVLQMCNSNYPKLPSSNVIFSLFEDDKNNVWIGLSGGVTVFTKDNQMISLADILDEAKRLQNARINAITQTSSGDIWLGGDFGICKLSVTSFDPVEIRSTIYEGKQATLYCENIQCLYEDSKGNLWAGAEGGGLMRYNKDNDSFISMNDEYGILADAIWNIIEDDYGDIWLSSNNGLIRLRLLENDQKAVLSTYTTTDGLSSNTYLRNSAVKMSDGELLFGSHHGYDRFYPDQLQEDKASSTIVITDIAVFNKSWNEYEPETRRQMSIESPDFTKKLTLKHNQNHFSIEFSALTFANPAKNKYAYKLDGYDTEWQYTDASNRIAKYNNLRSGIYTFHLKGSNENGIWNEKKEALLVEILPPLWQTTEAYVLYVFLFLLFSFLLYRTIRNRMKRQEILRMKELEQSKAEEVNHAKLQFFTNITHEFLTPLTILSASLDELKLTAPDARNNGLYAVMNANINRLIRLLQQILEFRKAESGNLKLKVFEGNITDFVKNAVEAFRPLMKKKAMDFNLTCMPEPIIGYFDPDKLDKIVYNLLSNAAKYNKEGNAITVTVSYGESTDTVLLSVRDNGEGLTEEEMKYLFTRFYEGNYRRYKTTGTGIGLSLTKDLVTLHKGEIRVGSEKGKGAEFTVVLPINKEVYTDEEISTPTVFEQKEQAEELLPAESLPQKEEEQKKYTLLLVEDNEEVLALMVRLLEREYHVLTALNGKQAVELVRLNEVSLIVSDIMMPEMDGVALCQYIKSEFDYCHIPVLLLTAKNKEEDRIEAYESGADSFLNKPFNTSLLHARIKNLLTKQERVARDFKKQLVFEVQDLNYTSMDEEFLQRAIAVVQEHLDDSTFDQPQFINEMATSKSTLYKKLKSLTGLNTSAFIRNIRLKAACQILEEKQNIRISELAYAVGFNDPKYFSACFKKEFGLLPKEYLEKLYPTDDEKENKTL